MKIYNIIFWAIISYVLIKISIYSFSSIANNLYTGTDNLFLITIFILVISLTSSLFILSYIVWLVFNSIQEYAQLREHKDKN